MLEDSKFATFPVPPSYTGPTVLGQSSAINVPPVADFDAMKRNFEATSAVPGVGGNTGAHPIDKKQRYAAASGVAMPQPFIQAESSKGGPATAQYPMELHGNPTSAPSHSQNSFHGTNFAAAAPFVPAAQAAPSHSSSPGGFSMPGSPYPAFGSPASQNSQALQQVASFDGSNFGRGFDTTPSTPNLYSPNAYATSFGNPLALSNQFLGMMPGMLGLNLALASPLLGASLLQQQQQQQQQQGLDMGFPMTNQSSSGSVVAHSGRTVYVGNLPPDASVDELLNQVRFGPIDSVKILPEKSCAFISFLDATTAAAFHSDAMMRKIRLHNQDLKIGWGKPSSVPSSIVIAVQQNGATRNVYLGNLDDSLTEQSLRDDLSRFGPIDQVKIVRDRAIAFVHFLSIATAIKVVQTLSTEPEWAGRRVNFGKDRCAYVPKNQHQQQQHNMAAAAMGSLAASYGGFGQLGLATPLFESFPELAFQGLDPSLIPGNRTVYLGNIHPDTTTEDICNTIRGGILQQIRYIADKHICFVTFVDPACALAFYQTAAYQGIALHNRRLKVGWGKASGPTPPGIAMVVHAGGSRNIYVGNIEDFETFNEERLRKDFGEYGEIELVNALPSKNASFVNFTNIANAIKAIEGMKQHPDYQSFRISYGKDRCGGTPRGGPLGRGFHGNQHSSNQQNHADHTKQGNGSPQRGDESPAADEANANLPPPSGVQEPSEEGHTGSTT